MICDHDGNILWNSIRDNTTSYLTMDETKESLKRSIGFLLVLISFGARRRKGSVKKVEKKSAE